MARLPLPKEHGAWALLYGPFLVLILWLGDLGIRTGLLFIALSSMFLAHEPLSRLARMQDRNSNAQRRNYWLKWLVSYLGLAAISGGILIFHYELWLLVPFGTSILLLLIFHAFLIAKRIERSVFGELVGTIGLTATIPIGDYVLGGQIRTSALFLWLLNILYFSSAIFYVKMTVAKHVSSRQEEARARARHNVAYHVGLVLVVASLAGLGLIPPWTLLAFVPIVYRALAGTMKQEGRLNLKKLGYTEVVHTVFFVLAISVIWRAGF